MSYFLLSVSLLFVGLAIIWRRQSQHGSRLPEPPGKFILGNILPQQQPWKALREYSLSHGAVFGLRLLAMRMVVISSTSAAVELFVNRSAIYSQRKPTKMSELSGMNDGVLLQMDVGRLRQARKLVASGLAPRELDMYRPKLNAHIAKFLGRLLHTPEKFLEHVRDLPISIMLEITYGYKAKEENDPFILSADLWVAHFARATAMSDDGFAVNWLPILAYLPSWFPGAAFKKTAAAWRKQAFDFSEDAYQYVVKELVDGVTEKSVVSKVLEGSEVYEKDVITKSATQMVTGGADTTVSAITSLILAMVLHPEVQRKAQAEIDRVVGTDRLPTFKDRSDLPMVDAVMKEILRCYPPIPITARFSIKDDVYEGYYIPQDSLILVNFWAMLHNTDTYPDPMTFAPERWLNTDIAKAADPVDIMFGYGRRECPGKHMAVELLFSAIAGILATFDIFKSKDANGRDITPAVEYTNGSISAPVPFVCSIKPRSDHAVHIIEDGLLAM